MAENFLFQVCYKHLSYNGEKYTHILCMPCMCRTVSGFATDFSKLPMSTMANACQRNQEFLIKIFLTVYKNKQVIDI